MSLESSVLIGPSDCFVELTALGIPERLPAPPRYKGEEFSPLGSQYRQVLNNLHLPELENVSLLYFENAHYDNKFAYTEQMKRIVKRNIT